jgi:hypothetical protein
MPQKITHVRPWAAIHVVNSTYVGEQLLVQWYSTAFLPKRSGKRKVTGSNSSDVAVLC